MAPSEICGKNLFHMSLLVSSTFLGIFDIPCLIKTSVSLFFCIRTQPHRTRPSHAVFQDDLILCKDQ